MSDGDGIGGVVRRNLSAAVVAAAATAAVQVGVFVAALTAVPAEWAAVAAVLMGMLWIVIAAPVFAAGGEGPADGLLRAAAVADGGAVVLVVLAVATEALTVGGAAKLYLLWMGLALAGGALTAVGRRRGGRQLLAAAAAALIVALAAAPFWANGLLSVAPEVWASRVVIANPILAGSQCLTHQTGFVWTRRPILYDSSILDRDVFMPPASWWRTTVLYAVVAAAMTVTGLICRREKRPPEPA